MDTLSKKETHALKLISWFLNVLILVALGLGVYLGYHGEWWMLVKGLLSYFLFTKVYFFFLVIPMMIMGTWTVNKTKGKTPTKAQFLPFLASVYAVAALILWISLELLLKGVGDNFHLYAQTWLVLAFFLGSIGDFFGEYRGPMDNSALSLLLHNIYIIIGGITSIACTILEVEPISTLLTVFVSSLFLIPFHLRINARVTPLSEV